MFAIRFDDKSGVKHMLLEQKQRTLNGYVFE